MPTRRATAVWDGLIRSGKGTFKGETGAAGGPYSFDSRFEEGTGSNPEELLAAAEASCFSMALSGNLERNQTPPKRIETEAACTVEKGTEGFDITSMKLDVRADVPGIDDAKFQEIARRTMETCPVSKALKGNMKFELKAQLV